MKPLNILEIERIVTKLLQKIDAQVQSVIAFESGVIIEIRKSSENSFIVIDLKPQAPTLLLFEQKLPVRPIKKVKPVALFLRAHLRGGRLSAVRHDPGLGRIVCLEFKLPSEIINLEIRLFPHGQNLLVEGQSKSISWNKPKQVEAQAGFIPPDTGRSTEQINEDWLGRTKTVSKLGVDWEKRLGKERKKINARLDKLDIEIQKAERAKESRKDYSHWLVQNQKLSVPEEWSHFVLKDKNVSFNINDTFAQLKKVDKKIPEMENRRALIREKLENLSIDDLKQQSFRKEKIDKKNLDLRQSAKRIFLSDSQYGEVGKSAKDNLDILRHARPWDYWLHLKDFPGSYGILHRNKNEKVKDADILKVASWVAKMSLRGKFSNIIGDTLEVLVCECRYLKPIKGDKLGRVTYTNAKTLDFKVQNIKMES